MPAYDNVYFNNGNSFQRLPGVILLGYFYQKNWVTGQFSRYGDQSWREVNFKRERKQLHDELLTQAVKNAKEKADLALEPLKACAIGLASLDLETTQAQRHFTKALNRAVAFDTNESTN